MISTHNYLIIQALGAYRPDIMSELSRTCTSYGCNLLNTKMNVLGEEIALSLFIAGNWGAIAKMETVLPSLEQKLGLSIQSRRTSEAIYDHPSISYTIQITGIDKPGILNGITEFLNLLNIPIEEISAHAYMTHTNTRMMSLHIKVNVPDKTHLATLREQFMNYCDDNNLDAFLEPLRNIY